jgi:DNA-directed RNA polymerase specialized sigma24 family protein
VAWGHYSEPLGDILVEVLVSEPVCLAGWRVAPRPVDFGNAVTVERESRLFWSVSSSEGAGLDPAVSGPGLFAPSGCRLRQALVARYGWELGLEAWHDAMAYGWEHQAELAEMANPAGYLYRVAQSSVRRQRRWSRRVVLPPVPADRLPDVEPGLPAALARLSRQQRVAVLLVYAHDWTQEEAAEMLGIGVSSLRNHLRRGVLRLRTMLGVDDE